MIKESSYKSISAPFWTPISIPNETYQSMPVYKKVVVGLGEEVDHYLYCGKDRIELSLVEGKDHWKAQLHSNERNLSTLLGKTFVWITLTAVPLAILGKNGLIIPAIALTMKILYKECYIKPLWKEKFSPEIMEITVPKDENTEKEITKSETTIMKEVPSEEPKIEKEVEIEKADEIATEKPKEVNNKILETVDLGNFKLTLKLGDLTKEPADIIVNAANRGLLPLAGVCGAIASAAGTEIFDECAEILKKQDRSEVDTAESVMTTSGKLKEVGIQAVIHTPGPIYDASQREECRKQLRASYENSLKLALNPDSKFVSEKCLKENLLKDRNNLIIAFPSISTAIYGYPIKNAAKEAISGVIQYLNLNHIEGISEVIFVFWDKDPDATHEYYLDALKEFRAMSGC